MTTLPTRRKLSPGIEWAARLTLVVVSVLLTLVVLELGCRMSRGHYWLRHWPNLVLDGIDADKTLRSRFAHDPILGFIPKAGFVATDDNVDALGNRAMAAPPGIAAERPPVLATGDSFTQGAEVADDESWPAYLQVLVGRRVLNAGVSAYGLDQIVLRTEQQAALLRPALIVSAFIADDLWRSEMRRVWQVQKSFFTVTDAGSLALHNVPVPDELSQANAAERRAGLSFWQRHFGWSVLAELILRRLDMRDEWISGNERATPAGMGERLACPLMRRLADLGVPTLIVAQYDPRFWRTAEDGYRAEQLRQSQLVLRCAAQAGLATLDTFEVVDKTVHERGLKALYLLDHHGAEGNRLIAETIAAELERRRLVPR